VNGVSGIPRLQCLRPGKKRIGALSNTFGYADQLASWSPMLRLTRYNFSQITPVESRYRKLTISVAAERRQILHSSPSVLRTAYDR
jgi:hypothetical protein